MSSTRSRWRPTTRSARRWGCWPPRTWATWPTTSTRSSSARSWRTSWPSPRASRCGSWADLPGPGSPYAGRVASTDTYRELGEAAWSWVLGQVRGDDGPWLPETVPEDDAAPVPAEDRDSLYDGIGGLAPVL